MTSITQLYNNIKTFVLQTFESKEEEDINLPIEVEQLFNYVNGKILNSPIILKFTGQTLSQYTSNTLIGSDIIIDYGDENVIVYEGDYSHTYTTSENYTIKIYGVIELENSCFKNCTGLTSINIPNTITSLENHCFNSCTGLTSINIPNTVTSLGDGCFYGCSGLTSIVIPNSVTSLGSSCFNRCTGLTSINIPNSVISLGQICFGYCTDLASITIPNSVTSLGTYCFYNCTGLTSITLNWSTNDEIITYNQDWIKNASSNLLFYIPNGTTSLYTAKGYPSDKLLEVSD